MKVLLCDPVADVVLDHFSNHDDHTVHEVFERDELLRDLADAHFLVVRSGTTVDREILDNGKNLIGVVRAGVGLDNIDLDYADEKGVTVHNTPEASTNAVAELVIGHILNLYRSISRADAEMKDGNWIKSQLDGREIQGKTVGIIGYGRIGQRVAELVEAFGANTVAYDAILEDDQIRQDGGNPVDFDELLRQADIVTVHVPLTDATKHLISTEELNTLNDNALVINCSRGGVFDEEAVNTALSKGRISGAGLDTYEEEPPGKTPVISRVETVATPHIGASTQEAQDRIGQLVVDKIEMMVAEAT